MFLFSSSLYLPIRVVSLSFFAPFNCTESVAVFEKEKETLGLNIGYKVHLFDCIGLIVKIKRKHSHHESISFGS